jgi:dynein heavy chain
LDWFSSWPEEALLSVATTLFSDYSFESDMMRSSIVEMCKEVHVRAKNVGDLFESQFKRKVFTTPKSYLDLINLYINTLNYKRKEVDHDIKRLSNGLTKLEQANT